MVRVETVVNLGTLKVLVLFVWFVVETVVNLGTLKVFVLTETVVSLETLKVHVSFGSC